MEVVGVLYSQNQNTLRHNSEEHHNGGVARRGVLQYVHTQSKIRSPSQTIGAIARGLKSAVTKRINKIPRMPGTPVWQRNYYEHIIRDERELKKPANTSSTIPCHDNWIKEIRKIGKQIYDR